MIKNCSGSTSSNIPQPHTQPKKKHTDSNDKNFRDRNTNDLRQKLFYVGLDSLTETERGKYQSKISPHNPQEEARRVSGFNKEILWKVILEMTLQKEISWSFRQYKQEHDLFIEKESIGLEIKSRNNYLIEHANDIITQFNRNNKKPTLLIVANNTDKESYINHFKKNHINIDTEYDATGFINASEKITIITKDQEDDILLKIEEKAHPFHSFLTCLEEINNELNSYQWENEIKECVKNLISNVLTHTKELKNDNELDGAFTEIIKLTQNLDENTSRKLFNTLREAGLLLDPNDPSLTKKIRAALYPDFSVDYKFFQKKLIEANKTRPENSSSSSETDPVDHTPSISSDSQEDDNVNLRSNDPETDTEAPLQTTENNFFEIMKELGDDFKHSLSYDKYTAFYNDKYQNKSKKAHFIDNTHAFEAQKECFFTTNDEKISPPLLGFVFNQLIQMPAFNEKDPDLEKTLEFLKIHISDKECIRLINSELSHVPHTEVIKTFKEKLKKIDTEKSHRPIETTPPPFKSDKPINFIRSRNELDKKISELKTQLEEVKTSNFFTQQGGFIDFDQLLKEIDDRKIKNISDVISKINNLFSQNKVQTTSIKITADFKKFVEIRSKDFVEIRSKDFVEIRSNDVTKGNISKIKTKTANKNSPTKIKKNNPLGKVFKGIVFFALAFSYLRSKISSNKLDPQNSSNNDEFTPLLPTPASTSPHTEINLNLEKPQINTFFTDIEKYKNEPELQSLYKNYFYPEETLSDREKMVIGNKLMTKVTSLANIEYKNENYEKTLELLQLYMEIVNLQKPNKNQRETLNTINKYRSITLANLGIKHLESNDNKKAIINFEEAKKIDDNLNSGIIDDNLISGIIHESFQTLVTIDLAIANERLGKVDLAITHFEEALKSIENSPKEKIKYKEMLETKIGDCYLKSGIEKLEKKEFDCAITELEKALDKYEKSDNNYDETLHTRKTLANAYSKKAQTIETNKDNFEKIIDYMEKAKKLYRQVPDTDPELKTSAYIDLATYQLEIVKIYKGDNNFEKAFMHSVNALENIAIVKNQNVLDPHHPYKNLDQIEARAKSEKKELSKKIKKRPKKKKFVDRINECNDETSLNSLYEEYLSKKMILSQEKKTKVTTAFIKKKKSFLDTEEKNNNLLGMIKHLEAIQEIEKQENTDPQSREFIENNIKLIELYRDISYIFFKSKDYQSEFLYRQKADALISTMPHIYQEDFELIKVQIKNQLVSTSITLSLHHMSIFDIQRSQKYIQIAEKKLKEIKTLNISEGQLEIELSKQITKNHEWLTDTKGRLKKLTH